MNNRESRKSAMIAIVTLLVVEIILIVIMIIHTSNGLPGDKKKEDEMEEYGSISMNKVELLEIDEEEALKGDAGEEATDDEVAYIKENMLIGIIDPNNRFTDFVTYQYLTGIKESLAEFIHETGYTDHTLFEIDDPSIVIQGTIIAVDMFDIQNENIVLHVQYNKVNNDLQASLKDNETGFYYPESEEKGVDLSDKSFDELKDMINSIPDEDVDEDAPEDIIDETD